MLKILKMSTLRTLDVGVEFAGGEEEEVEVEEVEVEEEEKLKKVITLMNLILSLMMKTWKHSVLKILKMLTSQPLMLALNSPAVKRKKKLVKKRKKKSLRFPSLCFVVNFVVCAVFVNKRKLLDPGTIRLDHGGEDLGDVIVDVDEEDLLNALADELGDPGVPTPTVESAASLVVPVGHLRVVVVQPVFLNLEQEKH